MDTIARGEAPVDFESSHSDSNYTKYEDVIEREVKYAVTALVVMKCLTFVEESFVDIFRTLGL